jgi:hypothetical protein
MSEIVPIGNQWVARDAIKRAIIAVRFMARYGFDPILTLSMHNGYEVRLFWDGNDVTANAARVRGGIKAIDPTATRQMEELVREIISDVRNNQEAG